MKFKRGKIENGKKYTDKYTDIKQPENSAEQNPMRPGGTVRDHFPVGNPDPAEQAPAFGLNTDQVKVTAKHKTAEKISYGK